MESFGEKLRTTRENLGYTIEQIARDTHISKRYLIALENEDFSIFPGETYLKGFLQNYSEYLGINSEEMITIYRNMIIQEQPIPMDQLLDQRPDRGKKPLLFAVIGGIAVLAFLAVFFFVINPIPLTPLADAEANAKKSEFTFAGEKVSLDVEKGLVITIPVSNGTELLTAQKVIDRGVTLSYKNGNQDLIIGEEKYFDLDNDGNPDISVFLKEVFTEQNQKKARVTLQQPIMGDKEAIVATASDLELIERGIAKVILEKTNPDRFTVDITVVRNCYIIYYIDTNAREEKYSYKSDTLSLTADRLADLRFSDGGSVKLSISGNTLDSGPSDQFFASQIKWVKSGDNKYQLVSIPVR